MSSPHIDLSGMRVLVTGGTGFIGGRLVERLILECQANVRVLVRNLGRAPRIARFPIEMIRGDVTNPADVERAMVGSEIVFHCAYGNRGSEEQRRLVNVTGTRNVLEAALHHGVKRVVHLSSLVVYGITADGDLDETAPRCYSGLLYPDSKLDAENLALGYVKRHALPVVVLQPTVVYGPFALGWTTAVLQALKTERIILVNGGDGLCNAVYIDDLVSAMLLAGVNEAAIGEAFLVSGEGPVTWRDFYGSFERMLGVSGTVSLTAAEALSHGRRQKPNSILAEALSILRQEPHIRQRILRTPEAIASLKIARSLLPGQIRRSLGRRIGLKGGPDQPEGVTGKASQQAELPIHPLEPHQVQYFKAKTRVRIDKAKRVLGYRPAFDLEAGMTLTEQWARWANLL